MKNKKRILSAGELVGYILSGLIALAGVTLSVLGMIGANLANLENPLRQASESFQEVMKLGFQPFGALVFVFGVIIAVIVLVTVGRRVDVEEERKARRMQRFSLEQDASSNVQE